MSVFLYTHYKDNDFELPVSLVYASNGYMPNVLSGNDRYRMASGMRRHDYAGGSEAYRTKKSTLMSNHAHQLKGYDYLAKDPDRHEVVKNAFCGNNPCEYGQLPRFQL